METDKWKDSLDHYGVTGDICELMRGKAKEVSNANPNSILSYSVWKALAELSSYFADPQGIPVEYAREISRIVEGSLKRLIDADAFSRETQEAYGPLGELLGNLHALRALPKDSHGWPCFESGNGNKEVFPQS